MSMWQNFDYMMRGKKFVVLGLIAVFVFLPFVPFRSSVNMVHCIFCDIVKGLKPETIFEMETDEFVIFKDIKPASTYHYLAVSKRHIESLNSLTKEDEALVNKMENGLKEYFQNQGININDALFGFHLPPFISVKHLHMHGIAPRSTMSFLHGFMFRAGSMWFKTVDEARKMLQEKM